MPKKDEQFYVDYVNSCMDEASDARKPLEDVWNELWQLYQNKQDWSKKSSWQSKAFIPKIFNQIFKSSGEIKRAIIQLGKLFKFDVLTNEYLSVLNGLEEMKRIAEETNDLMTIDQNIKDVYSQIDTKTQKVLFHERCFQKELGQTNFIPVYSEMIETAFLLGLGVLKVIWKKNKVYYENIDVFNFYISPDFMPFQEDAPRYFIERKEIDLAKLKKMAKEPGSQFIKSAVNKIEEDSNKLDDESYRRQRLGLGDYKKPVKKVEILEFWGDVIDENDKIEENQVIMIANGKYLIRHHDNKFNHKRPPYVLTMPMVYPHRGICGVSLVQPMAKLQYLYNNIVNMVADNLNYSVNKMFEYNPSDIKNPKGLTAIYPGKMVATNISSQTVREIVTQPVGGDAIKFLGVIDKEMQESTSITKPISGVTDSTRKTLGQHQSELAQARSTFDVIGRDLEQNSIRNVLEMTYDLYAQFADYEDREGLFMMIVGGVSMLMAQNELMERANEVLLVATKVPQLAQMTELNSLWKKYLSLLNLQDVYKEPMAGSVPLNMQQTNNINQTADQQAKQDVANMSPQEIMSYGNIAGSQTPTVNQ